MAPRTTSTKTLAGRWLVQLAAVQRAYPNLRRCGCQICENVPTAMSHAFQENRQHKEPHMDPKKEDRVRGRALTDPNSLAEAVPVGSSELGPLIVGV
jgi:hypothetical protein